MSEKKGRRIWSKRVTWVLLHAVHFFQTYREVGELEIALSFALLQMSLGHWSWKYLTGDLPRPAQPFREGHDAPVSVSVSVVCQESSVTSPFRYLLPDRAGSR